MTNVNYYVVMFCKYLQRNYHGFHIRVMLVRFVSQALVPASNTQNTENAVVIDY